MKEVTTINLYKLYSKTVFNINHCSGLKTTVLPVGKEGKQALLLHLSSVHILGRKRRKQQLGGSSTNMDRLYSYLEDDSLISNENYLAEDFRPGIYDVICGRGKKCYNHEGNKRFRELLLQRHDEYKEAETRLEKSNVLNSIVDEVRKRSPAGGFVKHCLRTGRWYEVGVFLAKEKTRQGFCDIIRVTAYLHGTTAFDQEVSLRRKPGQELIATCCSSATTYLNAFVSCIAMSICAPIGRWLGLKSTR